MKPWFDKAVTSTQPNAKESRNKGRQRKNQQCQSPNLLRKTKNVCWKGRRKLELWQIWDLTNILRVKALKLKKLLQDLTATPEETSQLRGHRFVNMLSPSALLRRLDPQGTLSFSNLLRELALKIGRGYSYVTRTPTSFCFLYGTPD